ncbi:MAG: carbonic anhydrase [Burkholderiales bacterium]
MASSNTDQFLNNNKAYADKQAVHKPAYPGKQPIQPSRRVAVVACMDARLDVEDLLGLQTGEAHIIRNAGGVVTDDAIRCLIISHHLLNTNEIILIHHTRCGMLAFSDDLLKAGLEGDPAAEKLLGQATSRKFVSCNKHASTPAQFHAFRGPLEPLDGAPNAKQIERLEWDVRRGMSAILNHPWIPTSGADAMTVRGFIYDVDTGKLQEVSYPGAMGSI